MQQNSKELEKVEVGDGGSKKQKIFEMIQDKNLNIYRELGGLEGLSRLLDTSMTDGITSSSLQYRRDTYGENFLPEEEEVTYLTFLKEALSDKMMLLLLVLGTAALVIGLTTPEQGKDEVHYSTAWIDGTFIIVAISLVVLVTTINDYLKEMKFKALNELTSKIDVTVKRNGKAETVDVSEILVGDLVEFEGGTFVSADGIFISGQGVLVDESACTGENDEKKKSSAAATDTDVDPFIISGTSVIAGEKGLYLCVAVGEESFSGRLEMATRTGKQPTPLQEKLNTLADLVGWVGIGVASILFFTLAAISIGKAAHNGDTYDFKLLLDYAIVGVSIVVVAVPEGLPLSVTIALAYSMQAMMKDNNMVRSLVACETMGAATNICSDKTGTLTTNEMTLVKAHIGLLEMHDYDYNAKGPLTRKELHSELSDKTLQLFIDSISFNSSAKQVKVDPSKVPEADENGKIWVGNKTERGMLKWVNRVRYAEGGFQACRDSVQEDYQIVYPFQSAKKSMTVLIRQQHPTYGNMTMQYTKGASEIILDHCQAFIDAEGNEREMTNQDKERLGKVIQGYANQAFRTIGVAFRVFGDYQVTFPDDDPMTNNLVFLGIAGIEDPVREEVPRAVKTCQDAGVTVRMCTGDNIHTAKAISSKCGLLTSDGIAMEGPAFRKLFCDDEHEFMKILPSIQVLARCSPLDKQLLVGNLMLLGEVVAVTGDGTNDAPALKLADVGFAMNDGTDVAKKASKIILLDNNFVSVVQACKWGRNVNDNIRKFLQFQFTVNVVLLIITFIGAVRDASRSGGNGSPPLAPVHLLWANLIMDTMAALALSTENPNEGLLKRPPTYRNAPLISMKMKRFIVGGSIYQLIVMLVMIFAGEELFETDRNIPSSWYGNGTIAILATELEDHQKDNELLLKTVIFNTFIYMQVFNWFNARKLYDEKNPFEGFGRSPMFLPVVVFTAAFQAFMVEVARSFMETYPPGGVRWGITIVLALLVFPVAFITRCIPVDEKKVSTQRLDQNDQDADDPNSKLAMIEKVRNTQRAMFSEKTVPDKRCSRMRKAFREAASGLRTRIRVVQAFRGSRALLRPSNSTARVFPIPQESK